MDSTSNRRAGFVWAVMLGVSGAAYADLGPVVEVADGLGVRCGPRGCGCWTTTTWNGDDLVGTDRA